MSASSMDIESAPIGPSQPTMANDVDVLRTNGTDAQLNETQDTNLNGHAKIQAKGSSDNTSEGPASNKSSDKMDSSPLDGTQPTIRKSSTTTVSKFKEKRPEPLKLNPTLNQDIPLDLSVKSAGNVPSGTLSNIFNLGPVGHMTTLETPRIQWQDNDTLLATGTNLRSSSNNMPHSASLVLESPSTFESQRAQILDRWTKINQLKADLINGPRRSCSSDNLSLHASSDRQPIKVDRLKVSSDERTKWLLNGGSAQIMKKNSISPLAIKSLSNTQNNSASQNKFSYTNSQAVSSINDSQRSPTASGKSLTPTSLANATANLLNIHLNSPPGVSQSAVATAFDVDNITSNQRSPYKSPTFPAFDHEISPLDPLISATFCNQQQSNSRTSSTNFPSPTSSNDLNNNFQRNMIAFQQQSLPSISSSATLNTPTLISPSQAGQLCFLQSPTLSPMSSVFDLPSPFLMFPPSSQNQHTGTASKQFSPKFATTGSDKTDTNDVIYRDDTMSETKASMNDAMSKSWDTLQSDGIVGGRPKSNNVSSANDLSRLITSATDKVASITQPKTERRKAISDEEEGNCIEMDIDCEISPPDIQDIKANERVSSKSRPATTIPQICISNHQLDVIDQSAKSTENIAKRSLSPGSFRAQVQTYRNERLESSSAPPDVYQRRARSKIKTVTADSCIDITCRNRISRHEVDRTSATDSCMAPKLKTEDIPLQPSLNHAQKSSRPYPEIREWFTSGGQLMHTQACANGLGSQLGARSNSAEPAVYPGLLSKRSVLNSSITDSANSTLNCHQSVAQSNNGVALSNSAQQLHYNSLSGATRLPDASISLHQTMVAELNRSNISNNQYSRYNSVTPYYQTNHQQSTSSVELSGFANSSIQRGLTNTGAISHGVAGVLQNAGQFYKHTQEPEQNFIRQNQISNVAGISSSLNRVDYLVDESHQSQVNPRRGVADNLTYVDQNPMMRQDGNQTSVMNLLCNNEFCQRQSSFVNNLQRSSTASMTTPLTMAARVHHPAPIASEIATNSVKLRGMNSGVSMRGVYQADTESRSDSRSSCSLDFSSQFMDGNSRPNSEAGSNMTSKKYHCDQCSKSFTRSDMLTRHKRLHSGDRPFQCSECKQEFSRSDHLSTHMRTHTGEKPYKCKLCSYSACRKDMITRHLKVHSRSPQSSDFI